MQRRQRHEGRRWPRLQLRLPRVLASSSHAACWSWGIHNAIGCTGATRAKLSHNIHAQYANSIGGIGGWDSPKERRQLGDRHPQFEFTMLIFYSLRTRIMSHCHIGYYAAAVHNIICSVSSLIWRLVKCQIPSCIVPGQRPLLYGSSLRWMAMAAGQK